MLATVVVNSTLDHFDISVESQIDALPGPDGMVTLREAIVATNNSAGRDTIQFDAAGLFAVDQAIALTMGELVVTDELSILGPGRDRLRIDAQGMSRVFELNEEVEVSRLAISISDLTVTGGATTTESATGGGIHNRENLNLTRVTIEGNRTAGREARGGGIFNGGHLAMFDVIVRDNVTTGERGRGGGIFSNNLVTIDSSTIVDNRTEGRNGDGGGVVNLEGNAAIQNSTIARNTTMGIDADGGGVYSNTLNNGVSGTTVVNSTLSNNKTAGRGGGYFNLNGATLIDNSTITQNESTTGMGSGVATFGDAETATQFASVIVAGNIGTDLLHVSGEIDPFRSQGGNIVGSGTTTAFALDDLVDVTDPRLGPLADNGGLTLTHLPLPGSPAIDQGGNRLALDHDQRGSAFPREVGGRADAGSVETRQQGPKVLAMVRNDGDDHHSEINSLTFTFSDDVSDSFATNDLQIFHVTTFLPIPLAGAAVEVLPGNQIRLALAPQTITPGHYQVVLISAGIENAAGEQLDGDDDGIAGGNYTETILVARPGDINLDGSVDAFDAALLFASWGGAGGSWASGDHNFDGLVDALDAGVLFAFWTGDDLRRR